MKGSSRFSSWPKSSSSLIIKLILIFKILFLCITNK
jgi:hypothetical protein